MEPCLQSLNEMLTTTYHSISKIEEVMLREMSGNTLSIREMHLLECIGKSSAGRSTVTEIAQVLGIKPPSVTQMVKRLEKKGYIRKDRSCEDGRQIGILLTDEGHRAEVAHRYFHRKMVRAIVKGLSPEERGAIASGLEKLNVFLETCIREWVNGKEED